MSAPINTAAELFHVRGLVAVITGGGSGLGAYAARALDANGATAVYIVGRREQPLKDVAASGRNGSIKYIVGDVTDKSSLAKIADQVRKEQGYINLLFANAGIIGPKFGESLSKKGDKPTVSEYQAALLAPSMEDFTQTTHVNVTAVTYTVATFLDLLDAGNRKGNVVQDSQVLVTASVAGFSRVTAAGLSYSVSKAAATHLVKMLSTAFAQNQFNIRVNAISPGLYPSEMTTETTADKEKLTDIKGHEGHFSGAYKIAAEFSPAQRTGSEQDFAGALLFLASPAGAFINGETLLTDGGRISQLPSVY